MALSYRYYRSSCFKVACVTIASIGLFWKNLSGRSNDSGLFLACLGTFIAAVNVALFLAMRRAKRRDEMTAQRMNALEAATGVSESGMVASLFQVGAAIEPAIGLVPPPFTVASDARGFALLPFGFVRVVEVEGAETLSRVIVKEGSIIRVRTAKR